MSDLQALLPGLAKLCEETIGDPEILVAVLDGPVDISHPCFEGANLLQIEPSTETSSQGKALAHGTLIASLIFGQQGSPVRGIAPGCRGLLISIFTDQDRNLVAGTQEGLAEAIHLAVQHGAHIINISAGEVSPRGGVHPALAEAIQLCVQQGVLVVAAAGNDGCECLHVPAALPGVLVAGAMDRQGLPMAASNWGVAYRSQGVLAPGENVPGARDGGGVRFISGSSTAAVTVSGIAALLLSLQRRWGKKPAPLEVRQVILDSATRCQSQTETNCQKWLAGRINVAEARELLKERTEVCMSETKTLTCEPMTEQSISEGLAGVYPAGCDTCQTGSQEKDQATRGPALVYALGTIGYDLGNDPRRNSLAQAMEKGKNPDNPVDLIDFLQKEPSAATSVIFTLDVENVPIYALKPAGPYASVAIERILGYLAGQLSGEVKRVSIPGWKSGEIQLRTGQVVPMLVPEIRGMFSWNIATLVNSLRTVMTTDDHTNGVSNFLNRVYYELRNTGLTPSERALNYAATNIYQAMAVFNDAILKSLALDSIAVEPSPLTRPGVVTMDVKLTFFDPSERLTRAREVYRLTVDVTDVVPVTVGEVRHWNIY